MIRTIFVALLLCAVTLTGCSQADEAIPVLTPDGGHAEKRDAHQDGDDDEHGEEHGDETAVEPIQMDAAAMADAGIRVSLFVDPDPRQLEAAARLGAPVVELHTGTYCEKTGTARETELARIRAAAERCVELGLECHAGHGLDYATVGPIAAMPAIAELNIGHFLIGEAIFVGFAASIGRMRAAMDDARAGASTP